MQGGKDITTGPTKKSKKNAGEMSSAFLPSLGANAELWKLEFFAFELDKKVTLVDSFKDHDTNLALALAIMLSNDVIAFAEENSETIKGLLVMQQV